MISRETIGRFLIAMLVVAQLGTTVHAAEHGHGDHDHDGVECLFVAVTSDDGDDLPPSGTAQLVFTNTSASKPTQVGIVSAPASLRIPPATGPPASV